MKIFISYASEDSAIAKAIALALEAEGHKVFIDRSALIPGGTFNREIRHAIEASQLFIFLVSPNSIAKGRYTLTEMEFAEKKWPRPWGKVLSVTIAPTPKADIPPYLRAGTLLQPQGDVPATVAAEINRLSSWWSRLFGGNRLALVLLTLLLTLGVGAGWWYWREVNSLLNRADFEINDRHYAEAWTHLQKANNLAPFYPKVQQNAVKLSMAWLEDARYTEGKGSFSEIVDKALPALTECSVGGNKTYAAGCIAHIGWGDFLKSRDGVGGLNPAQFYQKALALDPDNPYANTFAGFNAVLTHQPLDTINAYFDRALDSGRNRQFVRRFQLAAFSWYAEHEYDLLKALNAMRLNDEPVPVSANYDPSAIMDWSKAWNMYFFPLAYDRQRDKFLATLSPPEQLATYQWLFPQTSIPKDKIDNYHYMLAVLMELAGQNAQALAIYKAFHQKWGKYKSTYVWADKTFEAAKRLSKTTASAGLQQR